MIITRDAKIKDIYDIHKCGKTSLPIYYSYLDLTLFLLNKNYSISIAIDDNNHLLGYAIYHINDTNNSIHILSLAVNEQYRKKGVGTKLMEYIFKNNIRSHITLYVHVDNHIAIKFYEKNGFIKQKILNNYYKNSLSSSNTDAYKMIRYNYII